MEASSRPEVLRVGVGGPVGSGKTALVDLLCKRLRQRLDIAVVTNDIYTREDAEFLIRSKALPAERIRGVETGGCPHTAIREDASMNLAAIDGLMREFQQLDMIIVESGGDNLAATFSPELSDLTLYVIDVAAGDKIPRKGGPGIIRSDLLIINKIDLAPHVGASLEVMERDARKMRGERPFVFANIRAGTGVAVHRDRGMLVHSRHVVADMAVNLHVEVGIEAAGDRMRTIRVFHLDLRHPFAGCLLVQKQIQVPQAVAGEIEFAQVRHRHQIRHE